MSRERFMALQQFIRHLVTAVSTTTLYSIDHLQVTRLVAAAAKALQPGLASDSELTILLVDEQLVAEDMPLPSNLYISRFLQLLKARGVQFIKIGPAVTDREILALVAGLSKSVSTTKELTGSENIRFGKVTVRSGSTGELGCETAADEGTGLTVDSISSVELAKFMEIYESVRKDKRLKIVGLYDIVGGFIKAFKQEADSLLVFAPLRAMDEYTFTHSTNVCVLNIAQAMALGIDGPLLHDIGIAAMLHDIGKLFVPEEILSKPGKLTDKEYEIIQQHPLRGAQHLLDTPGVPRLAVVTAYEHHMKYNFTGYPRVPSGWEQNLCSQMTSISDFFDALRSKRTYRGPLALDAVTLAMRDMAGTEFHPALVNNFLKIMFKHHQADSSFPDRMGQR
jgi:HD-GYP domain-containing protein (c-di-GMP phosphodiesterase class II)